MEKSSVLAHRLIRQRLDKLVEREGEYRQLFASLQPVSPIYFTRPGDPPSLVHRTRFSDQEITDSWRPARDIVKGRFLNGTIGYVLRDDLELYANAFQRPLDPPDMIQELVLDTLEHVGPLTPRQLKEETRILNKVIMPALHRLQEAFLVYEDQVDSDWERSWSLFSQEWPDMAVGPDRWESAAGEVQCRFLYTHVFATFEQIKDWSGWPVKGIKLLIRSLEADDKITPCKVDGLGEGWMLADGVSLDDIRPSRSVFMLHKADPLVRTSTSELKRRFAGQEVLQYLLIDGEFRGAVCGHWRIGPHDVEDIVLELPADECTARKTEILQAVAWYYKPPNHTILHYNGESLSSR